MDPTSSPTYPTACVGPFAQTVACDPPFSRPTRYPIGPLSVFSRCLFRVFRKGTRGSLDCHLKQFDWLNKKGKKNPFKINEQLPSLDTPPIEAGAGVQNDQLERRPVPPLCPAQIITLQKPTISSACFMEAMKIGTYTQSSRVQHLFSALNELMRRPAPPSPPQLVKHHVGNVVFPVSECAQPLRLPCLEFC